MTCVIYCLACLVYIVFLLNLILTITASASFLSLGKYLGLRAIFENPSVLVDVFIAVFEYPRSNNLNAEGLL